MQLKVFTLPTCPKCPDAKRISQEVAKKLGIEYKEIDLTSPDGHLEGLMYQIMSAPSIVLGDEVLSRGNPIPAEELEAEIKKHMSK